MKGALVSFTFCVCFVFGCSLHYHTVNDDHVHLYLKKSGAGTVYFANSSDGFKLHKAVKIDHTTWEVIISSYREFSYFYIIDNKTFLPDCRFKETDDFGNENCIYMPDM
jgi:hypothetical protein